MTINLNQMSLKELKDLAAQVAKAIASFEERKKKEALTELEDKARDLGYSLADLLSGAGPRKRAPAVPKYANPANRSDTWSGRGRKPRWYQAALDAGKSPGDLLV